MRGKFLIYQLLPRLFGNLREDLLPGASLERNGSGCFEDIDDAVLAELRKLSITHLWFTGVIDHATAGDEGVKGEAGSPYAIRDYYRVCDYMTRGNDAMQAYEALLKRTRVAGLVPLMDFVPNHVARCYASDIQNFEDINYYPGRGYDYDWSDTAKLNYEHTDTWSKMRDILLFWLGKGVGGFRCDMVHLVPVAFWQWVFPQVRAQYPEAIFIAEIYSPELYGAYLDAGFDYLYDKVGLYDTLRNILDHKSPASDISLNWMRLEEHQLRMLNFLENHDEQRLASAFFAGSPWRALPALYVSLFFNTVPYMLYFGQELGEAGMESEGFSGVDGRTTIFDFWSVASVRSWLKGLREGDGTRYLSTDACQLQCLYRRLFATAMRPVFRYGKTFDLQYANPHNNEYDPRYHFSFLRGHEGEVELVVTNFSEWDAKVKINLPAAAASYLDAPELPTTVTVAVDAWNGVIIKLV